MFSPLRIAGQPPRLPADGGHNVSGYRPKPDGRRPRLGCGAGIAQTLSLSESAVENHISAIFAKLGQDQPHTHRRVTAVLAYLRTVID